MFMMLLLAILLNSTQIEAAENLTFSAYIDKSGHISLPDDFKLSMTHPDSWYVLQGGASSFHDVYTEAESVRVYHRAGKFPDGAAL